MPMILEGLAFSCVLAALVGLLLWVVAEECISTLGIVWLMPFLCSLIVLLASVASPIEGGLFPLALRYMCNLLAAPFAFAACMGFVPSVSVAFAIQIAIMSCVGGWAWWSMRGLKRKKDAI